MSAAAASSSSEGGLRRRSDGSEDGLPSGKKAKHPEGTDWVATCHKRQDGKTIGKNDALGYMGYPLTKDIAYKSQCGQPFKLTYLVYQEEAAPSSGQLHLQMFFITDRKVKLEMLRKIWPGIHLELRMAETRKEAADYCRSQGKYEGKPRTENMIYEQGAFTEMEQGKRSDLLAVQAAIQDDATLHDLASMHFSSMVRYGRGIQQARQLLSRPDANRPPPHVYLIIGPSGCGKSLWARHMAQWDGEYMCPDSNNSDRWSFETYDNEQCILLDELRGSEQLSATSLLLMCDGGRQKFPGRNVSPWMKHRHVIITSNLEPHEWGYAPSFLQPFLRRVKILLRADYNEWKLDPVSRAVPSWLTEHDLWLDRSSGSFKNPTEFVLDIPCAPPARVNLPATSRDFIVPLRRSTSPISVDDDFDLSPHASVTQRFVYDLTQEE